MRKPPSAKAKAAKAKREKITGTSPVKKTTASQDTTGQTGTKPASTIVTTILDEVEQRVKDSYDRTWGRSTMEMSYPSRDPTASVDRGEKSIHDFLTAEEAEKQMNELGPPGPPHHATCALLYGVGNKCNCRLDDEVPNFLHTSAKAGPPRKPLDAIALGETVPVPRQNFTLNNPEPAKRVVTLMRDHELQYPDLFLAVHILPDWADAEEESRFVRMFVRAGCFKAKSLEEADLVIFGGGSDVEPVLYGEKDEDAHESVYFDKDRDDADMEAYLQCLHLGIPMFGVCRGSQFLHVMNGGKLHQDIEGHYGSHKCFDVVNKQTIDNVSSVHHQSCIINRDMDLLLTSTGVTKHRWFNKFARTEKQTPDVEGFFYRNTGCLGVQGHPEYANCSRFQIWCLEQINHLFCTSPDFEINDGRLRMTQTAMDSKAIGPGLGGAKTVDQADYIENAYNGNKEV